MSISTVVRLVLATIGLIASLSLFFLAKRLKKIQIEYEKSLDEIIARERELEVIKGVQEKIKTSKEKEGPNKVDSPVEGDSTSRINRLNGVSDRGKN